MALNLRAFLGMQNMLFIMRCFVKMLCRHILPSYRNILGVGLYAIFSSSYRNILFGNILIGRKFNCNHLTYYCLKRCTARSWSWKVEQFYLYQMMPAKPLLQSFSVAGLRPKYRGCYCITFLFLLFVSNLVKEFHKIL